MLVHRVGTAVISSVRNQKDSFSLIDSGTNNLKTIKKLGRPAGQTRIPPPAPLRVGREADGVGAEEQAVLCKTWCCCVHVPFLRALLLAGPQRLCPRRQDLPWHSPSQPQELHPDLPRSGSHMVDRQDLRLQQHSDGWASPGWKRPNTI